MRPFILSFLLLHLHSANSFQFFWNGASPSPASASPSTTKFDSHRLFPLSDGTLLPSPAFGAGSVWKGENVTEIVLSALNQGYRHLDNAAFYANQESVADAIRASAIPRGELYLTSKYDRLNGQGPEQELYDTLRKLNTTYLDLYLIHVPQFGADRSIWPTFESFVHRGLVRSIGVSNYLASDLERLLASESLTIVPAVNQIKLHLYNQLEMKATIELCRRKQIQIAAYSTLTSLTTRHGGKADRVVEKIAERHQITEGQTILKWADQKDWAIVSTSGKDYRQKQQLQVFEAHFPKLSKKEMKVMEHMGRKQEKKDHH
ncbi:BQ5605_C028g10541 [Microbotryum silenes-dioicae]|uniref:BQ5605_C028g10541 protein n=1 Tax=Microbotryum silenes-dioicae TaxID=796604 RepID=A0A2X0MLE5_9BASI|nr:BQ5605_C028g10541 [Microbotryum silenes-dioicae]